MAITLKSNGGGTPVPEGVHIATCVRVIDLGTQFSQIFGNSQRKLMLTWEVPGELVETKDGDKKPMLISRTYTQSLSDKAILRQHLEAWRGKAFSSEELNGFDPRKVLGAPCQIQVIHNEKGYADVKAVMALPKGTPRPEQAHKGIYFDLSDPGCLDVMEELPDYVKDKIKASPEYGRLASQQLGSVSSADFDEIAGDDDLPF